MVQTHCLVQPIKGNTLQHINPDDLSNDQRYLYKMNQAILSGQCPSDLADCRPGPMAHAQWLTRASRILRLYISIDNPSTNLCTLLTYIVRVYAPVWFEIKSKPSCVDGARHLWKLKNYTRFLPVNLREVVDPVIERNAYFAHPGNHIISRLTDERPGIRKLPVKRIFVARTQNSTILRVFKVSSIIFTPKEYFEMIDWLSSCRVEPSDANDGPANTLYLLVRGERYYYSSVLLSRFTMSHPSC